MAKTLSDSKIDRDNILNNPYVISPIQDNLWLNYPIIEWEMKMTISQVAEFFEIDTRTIERVIEKYRPELEQNWYRVFTWESLQIAKSLLLADKNVGESISPNIPSLWLFNFRSFLNVAMLISNSEKAKELRSIILDIVLDVMRQKTWWSTKYINQRDEDFLASYVDNINYRKEFTMALNRCIEAGPSKYPLMTNKIYHSIFGEHTKEYRLLLKLWDKENIRHTLYKEVLDVISQYEIWYADFLTDFCKRNSKKVSYNEAEKLFDEFAVQRILQPTRERARQMMATRDNGLRDIIHDSLQPYIKSLDSDEYKKFLADYPILVEKKTWEALDIIDKHKDIFIRLKDR